MFKFFHELMNPHCPHCRDEREESYRCDSCEILKVQLDRANYEREQLLNRLLKTDDEPSVPVYRDTEVKSKVASVPWNVKRQMLETESREKARILRENSELVKLDVDKLEKEIGVG